MEITDQGMDQQVKDPKTQEKVYSVSEINASVKLLLDETFPLVWVSGEISNLVQPSSGHIYFSLKDEFAQVRVAMFRGRNNNLRFQPKNGLHVKVQAQITLYEQRGDYQLIVYNMEEAGDGILHEKFLKLKEKLLAQGLFDVSHKKPLPKIPQCIGVITSPTGAAIRDILSVLKRRFPSIPVIIYPTQVQGDLAAGEIANALQIANERNECDILIIARGGGSIEDLWPFNEEIVARAIFKSDIPTISGIGHEIDFTIADFVVSKRAPTPSAAAELAVPDAKELCRNIAHIENRLTLLIQHKIRHFALLLTSLKQRLKHPRQILQQKMQRLDDLEQRIKFAIKQVIKNNRQKVASLAQILDTVSPLATLNRGYAIVSKDNKILRDANEVAIGDKITARFARGSVLCVVEEKFS